MTQEDFWEIVQELNFKSDNDFERCSYQLTSRFELGELLELEDIAWDLVRNLHLKFPHHQDISDDGWSDLCYDIVSRGKEFYESITEPKIKEMIKSKDYVTSFGYSFH